MEEKDQASSKVVPVEWVVPFNIVTQVVTNIIVQHTPEEFLISFFEAVPPPFIGTDEEIAQQYEQISSVRAMCVARIHVTPARMEEFVQVLQDNLSRWKSRFESE